MLNYSGLNGRVKASDAEAARLGVASSWGGGAPPAKSMSSVALGG
jgi:hypothetical protein